MLSHEATTKEELATTLLNSISDTVWVPRKLLIQLVGVEAAQELLPSLPERVAVNRKTTLSKCDKQWLSNITDQVEKTPP